MSLILTLMVTALTLTGCRRSNVAAEGAVKAAQTTATAAPDANGYWREVIGRYGQDYRPCILNAPAVRPAKPVASASAPALRNVVVALDSSGSMAGRLAGERKIDAAKRAAASFLGGLPADINVGLVVYGHRGNNRPAGRGVSCAGVEVLYPLGPHQQRALAQAVDAFEPTGWTPLATAIRLAAETAGKRDEAEKQNAVYVVSDGLETCDGDPVVAARTVHEANVRTIVNIIGFRVDSQEQRALRAVAEAGGGEFFPAATGDDLRRIFERVQRGLQSLAYQAGHASAGAYNRTGTAAKSLFASACFDARMMLERNSIQTRLALDSGSARPKITAATVAEVRTRLDKRLDALREWQASELRKHEQGYQVAADELRSDLERVLKQFGGQ